MINLSSILLKESYHKGIDNIATEFYLPCMSAASSYDRAVGFFSSAIFALAWSSLKIFVSNGGRIRFICSPVLSHADIRALDEGYIMRAMEDMEKSLTEDIKSLLSDPYFIKPTKVLATLVALGIIDIKIATMTRSDSGIQTRLFHDKLGIFGDGTDYVVFKGSMNETLPGLSQDGNLESIDVFVTWAGEREAGRVRREQEYFETLWRNEFPTVQVAEFPDAARRELVKAAEPERWPEMVDQICEDILIADTLSAERGADARKPKPHQIKALTEWFQNDRRGILQHATGSGKTYTGLCAIRDALKRGETALILVPSDLLLQQWREELTHSFSDIDIKILFCGGGNLGWKDNGMLGIWSAKSTQNRIILSTMQTASSDDFIRLIREGDHLFLLADEVHRLGSPTNSKILTLQTGSRLGLSATPRRAGDPVGTAKILDYFHGILPSKFTLQDAIKSGVLTPYMYYVHLVHLTAEEQKAWDNITKKLGILSAQNREKQADDINQKIKYLLIQRARIAKSASGKVNLVLNILQKHYDFGQRWIVYCDDQDQVRNVLNVIRSANLGSVFEYHYDMAGDRKATLHHFEATGGIIVAIRCLDEGVDIPSVTHALILASSRNPREFIQRRGRVLRRANNKPLSYIHDALVLPESFDPEETDTDFLSAELSRAIEFGENAANPSSVTDLEMIALRYNIDYHTVKERGLEDDE